LGGESKPAPGLVNRPIPDPRSAFPGPRGPGMPPPGPLDAPISAPVGSNRLFESGFHHERRRDGPCDAAATGFSPQAPAASGGGEWQVPIPAPARPERDEIEAER